jgi:hypothetical protein
MTTTEAVIWSFRDLLDRHQNDLLEAEQVNSGFLPKAGHGDDIWLRTERVHIVAEVTLSGEGCSWGDTVGVKRQNIIDKLQKLRQRTGATHRYLFLAECIAASVQKRVNPGEVMVVGIPSSTS